jgi:cell division protein FtsQ
MRGSRHNRPILRGSVRQNTIRMRSAENTGLGFLLRLGALVGSVFLILAMTGWLWHIGWPQRQAEHLVDASLRATQKAQFSIKDIIVEGRQQTSKDVLSLAIGTIAGAPILGFDPEAAQARIATLPWIASAIVERRLPDIILIRLTERVPLARWQHEGKTVVIDTIGGALPEAKLEQFAQLPLLVGADVPGQAHAFLDTMQNYPEVMDAMTAAVRVGERRWDLHLRPKVVAKLPENNIDFALKRLSSLITDQKILEHDIIGIDLRIPDRFVIESGTASPTNAHPAGDMRL